MQPHLRYVSFDVDPWLLLEHNPQGVLKDRLAHAKRRPRKKLKWEHEQPNQVYAGACSRAAAAAPRLPVLPSFVFRREVPRLPTGTCSTRTCCMRALQAASASLCSQATRRGTLRSHLQAGIIIRIPWGAMWGGWG